jgi:hypothetical protein
MVLAALGTLPDASAQVEVHIAFKRQLYLIYEPIICTVTIVNRTGRELTLQDTPENRWFSFQIETPDGRPIPPVDPNYANSAVQVGSGQTLRRSVNLTPLFPLREFGTYRVRSTIYAADLERFFSSPTLNIEITEGRTLWQQVVGVPPSDTMEGKSRKITMLAHRLPQTSMLYIRIQDDDRGVVYCTHQLGRFIAFGNPDVELDANNQVHVLQNVAPKSFVYSHVGLNGEVIKRQSYQDVTGRPILVKTGDGTVTVQGGTPFDPNAPSPTESLPALHDRPVPLPTPEQKLPSGEDPRPSNLLSR